MSKRDENSLVAEANQSSPVERAVEIRAKLRGSVELVTADDWGALRGIPIDPGSVLSIYRGNQCVFSIQDGIEAYYPRFQFDETGEPLLGIALVLEVVPPMDGWALLSWFEAPNRLLDGEKPSSMIASHPDRVLDAARRFYGE